jgi:hypothetical protein
LDAKSPIIEFDARMTLGVRRPSSKGNSYVRTVDNNQGDLFADISLFHEPKLKTCRDFALCKGKSWYRGSSRGPVSRSTQADVSDIEESQKISVDYVTQSALNSRCDDAEASAGDNRARDLHSCQDIQRPDIGEVMESADTAGDAIDFALTTCKPGCSACWTSLDDLSKGQSVNETATSLDCLETKTSYSLDHELPSDELPVLMPYSPYDWIPNLSLDHSFLEDATPLLAKQFDAYQEIRDESSVEQPESSDQIISRKSPGPVQRQEVTEKGNPPRSLCLVSSGFSQCLPRPRQPV